MTDSPLEYSSLDPIGPEAAEAAFRSGDWRAISLALLRLALNGPDWDGAERRAVDFAAHPNVWVRRNAATALGHVARLTGRLSNPDSIPTLRRLLTDPEVAGWAEDSLDDVEIYMHIQRKPVESTAVASVGYNPASSTLEVEFQDGGVYQYDGVPAEAYEALLSAESVGAYLDSRIKPTYGARLIHA